MLCTILYSIVDTFFNYVIRKYLYSRHEIYDSMSLYYVFYCTTETFLIALFSVNLKRVIPT